MYRSKSCVQHISVSRSSLVCAGFADEYRPILQSSLRQLMTHCASLLRLLLPQEDEESPPRYVALCNKLKLTEKVSWLPRPSIAWLLYVRVKKSIFTCYKIITSANSLSVCQWSPLLYHLYPTPSLPGARSSELYFHSKHRSPFCQS